MGNSFSTSRQEESSEEIATTEYAIEAPMDVEEDVDDGPFPYDSPSPPSPASSDILVMEDDESSEPTSPREEVKVVKQDLVERRPYQHWVWKFGKTRQKTGTWIRTVKDARPSSTQLAAFGPPTSLLSLPLELLDMILSRLTPHDLTIACRVSSLLLQRSSATLYKRVKLEPAQAVLFLSARILDPPPPPFRIPHQTVPSSMQLQRNVKVKPLTPLASLSTLPANQPPLSIHRLELKLLTHKRTHGLESWAPFLKHMNPLFLLLDGRYSATTHDPPTIGRSMTREAVASFTDGWTRLNGVVCQGPRAIPLITKEIGGGGGVEGEPKDEFAFSERLEKNAREGRKARMLLQQKAARVLTTEELEEKDLGVRLAEPSEKKPSTHTRGRWGLNVTVERLGKVGHHEDGEGEGRKDGETGGKEEKKEELVAEEEEDEVWVEI